MLVAAPAQPRRPRAYRPSRQPRRRSHPLPPRTRRKKNRFAESDLHNLLANKCTQLRYLCLNYCDTGFYTTFKIDVPDSKLSVLEFSHCTFDRVELFCLPKLKQLICGFWLCPCLPMTLGYVPCLKEVEFYGALTVHSEPFKLSEFLCGTSCIDSLTLDFFFGRKIWLQPKKDQLRSGFSNLRQLCLHDIFVGFGLMWTTTLLEAAPSLEILRVEVVLLVLLFFNLEKKY
ncbi:uncharacterized protein [Miscanthus floridulus]|uniref:uncharacterized protein n=1 Tax=Miscanthus floridulus TaxID=154761 RepID=UPI0034583385